MGGNFSNLTYRCPSDCLLPCKNDIYYEAIWFYPKNSLVSEREARNGFFIKNTFSMRSDADLFVFCADI